MPKMFAGQTLTSLVDRNANQFPDRLAVVSNDEAITYSDLMERSRMLSRWLIAQGLRSEEMVVLIHNRSVQMVVDLIAVLLAGGAWVPISPQQPLARIQQLLGQVNPRFILSDVDDPVVLGSTWIGPAIKEKINLGEHPDYSLPEIDPGQLAYVLFTSGSTGLPKGVMVEHRSVVAMLNGFERIAPIECPFNGLSVCSYVFDVSVWEFFSALGFGGTLYLAEPDSLLDTDSFCSLLSKNAINSGYFPPGVLIPLGNELLKSEYSVPLKRILVGVEPILGETLSRFSKLPSDPEIINGYGPTEATICATFYKYSENDEPKVRVPIGRALPGYEIVLLDESYRLVEKGQIGEIAIGGVGLARGYLGLDDLTESCFVNHPSKTGERLYLTGDYAHEQPDGNLVFRGRADNQVKIHGYRIELAEIEKNLESMPLITASAVINKSDSDWRHTLLCYYETDEGRIVKPEELQEWLNVRLPVYMIPNRFVQLNKLPRTVNGKIDRDKLSSLEFQNIEGSHPPLAGVNEIVQKVWRKVLGYWPRGDEDDFFKAGGDSLSAMHFGLLIAQSAGIKVAVKTIFENPTPRALSDYLTLKQPQHRVSKAMNIPKPDEPFPLAYTQQRPWLLFRLGGDTSIYNLPLAYRIKGFVDESALEKALRLIVQRHESLRLSFGESDGLGYQKVNSSVPFALVKESISQYKNREESLVKYLNTESGIPFDLSQPPLFRASLLKMSDNDQVLFIVTHHLVLDGWSLGILHHELEEIYKHFLNHQSEELTEPVNGWTRFVAEQQTRFNNNDFDDGLRFMERYLKGVPLFLQLPSWNQRPAYQSFKGKSVFIYPEAGLVEAISDTAHLYNVSSFMLLMAAFSVWLNGLTGSDDFVAGTMTASRNNPESLNVIGFYSESIPIRFTIPDDLSFDEWLLKVKDNLLEVFGHQDIPFELLLRKLNPPRNNQYNPIFQVMLVHFREVRDSFYLGETECESLHLPYPGSKLDLTLYINEYPGKLMIMAEYNAELFDSSLMQSMLDGYVNILRQCTTDPSVPLSKIHLVNDHLITELKHSSGESVEGAPFFAIPDMVYRQAALQPEAIAIMDRGINYSYGWLKNRAESLTGEILRRNPEKGAVALLAGRSNESVAAMLAIMSSGCLLVPLSAHIPSSRIVYIMNDAEVRLIVADGSIDIPQEMSVLPVVDLNTSIDSIPLSAETVLEECPAYCIYTSGTSGKPKGVVVSHGNLSNFIQAAISYYEISNKDRILQFASFAFDASVEEIWTTWCAGATLVIRDEEMISSASRFMQQCDEYRITVLDLPTAYFHHLAGSGEIELFKIPHDLRLVILGGEALQPAMVTRWRKIPGGTPRLINTYGPTEATVVALWSDVNISQDLHQVFIGTPVPGNQVYVVDKQIRLVPPGVTGELLIGGKGVVSGYLNNPELTERSFIRLPFAQERIFYRTGDLVRYHQSGSIEFLGRLDDQIKIRGFRVEPSEIESVIARWPGVHDVIVAPYKSTGEDLVLCCWYRSEEDIDPEELRKWLIWQLPEYMVPSAWVRIDAVPMTPSGKVDKSRLPFPLNHRATRQNFQHPADEIQQDLILVWSSVLGSGPSEPDENFFLRGGHSLLAATLLSQVRQRFKVEILLRDFFSVPTFSGLEKLVRNNTSNKYLTEQVIMPFQWEDRIPLSSSQHRIWFLEKLETLGAVFSIPLSFRLHGLLKPDVLNLALNRLIEARQMLRAYVLSDSEGNPELVFIQNPEYKIEIADFSSLPPGRKIAEMTSWVQRNERLTFDPAIWPLFRVSLIQLAPDDWYLLLNFHHLIADSRSIGLFVEEFGTLYNRLLVDQAAVAKPESPCYTDYIFWQQQWLASEEASKQIGIWVEKLTGASSILHLPTDRPRPSKQSFEGDEVTIKLSAELVHQLKEIAAHRGASLNTILLTCFSLVLSRYTAQYDFVIGVPVAGRTAEGTERLFGTTINNLPVRINVDGKEDFGLWIEEVNRAMLDALSLQEIPFERIVKSMKLHPDMSITPLFQVMFNMLNAHNEELRLRGCNVDFIEPSSHSAQYDLTLIVKEREQELWITFEYTRLLFDQITIRHLSRALLTVTELVAFNSNRKISQLGLLLPADEYHPLRRSASREVFPRIPLPELFLQTAEKYSTATAIVAGNVKLRYAEAASKMIEIANVLHSVGCNSSRPVGVLVERNEWLPLALLAVQKAGSLYVPLDPVYPSERLSEIIRDAGIELLLVSKSTFRFVPNGNFTIIHVDELKLELVPGIQDFPEVKMSAPAYLIYTSGSTGKPKGVQISHASLSNLLWSIKNDPGMSCDDRLLAVTTVSFDIAALELFVPLISGAVLVIASEEEQQDAWLLGNLIEQNNITLMQATPVTWRMMLHAGWLGSSDLTLLCGGEALPRELASQLIPRCRKLYNMYGPTETTIWSSLERVDQVDEHSPFIRLGKPIANNFLYVTDEYLNPVPPGVPGELLIGGEGVAIGYLNRPELNREKFLPDPFDTTPGARVYRTGDLVKLRNDGTFDFLGRNDNQIKLRGFRIEPGEIESLLTMHPAVRQAVVVIREDYGTVKRLVAYLEGENSQSVNVSFKDFLSAYLPGYMIPSAFVWMDELPHTGNGKIDRKLLPVPDTMEVDTSQQDIAPQNSTEEAMLEIWKEILKLEHISVTDDFFDLGGDSLMAVGLMARVELRFNFRLPLATLFHYSTLRELSSKVSLKESVVSWRSLVVIRPMGHKPPVFLIHGAGLNVLLYNSLVLHFQAGQPIYALQAWGLDGKEKPLETIEEIASHYISEIRSVSQLGPFALAGFSLGGIIAFEMAKQMNEMGLKTFFVGMFDTVAYTSEEDVPILKRKLNHLMFYSHQILFNLKLILFDSSKQRSRFIRLKINSIKQIIERVKLKFNEQKAYITGDRDKLQHFALPVHEINNRAGERYHLKPTDIRIDLFKARQATFYIAEPKYYGWSEYAKKGVDVHEVPGEHNTIFHPPHDKQFAITLQRCIDEAFDRYQKKSVG